MKKSLLVRLKTNNRKTQLDHRESRVHPKLSRLKEVVVNMQCEVEEEGQLAESEPPVFSGYNKTWRQTRSPLRKKS